MHNYHFIEFITFTKKKNRIIILNKMVKLYHQKKMLINSKQQLKHWIWYHFLYLKKKNLINLKNTFHKMLSTINNFETINLSDVFVFNRMSCGVYEYVEECHQWSWNPSDLRFSIILNNFFLVTEAKQ